jgi:Arc/MetJ family transcription regulator
MGRITITIDEDLVAEAADMFGTATPDETVACVLTEVLADRRRCSDALARLRALVADGAIDQSVLEDKRNYRR